MNIRILSLCSLAAALSVSASNSLSAAVTDAKPVVQVAPAYPPVLRASDVEGDVVLAFTITAKGDVADVELVSSTEHQLATPAMAALRQWKFTPAMKDGVAVSVRAVQPLSFRISELGHSQLVAANSRPNSLDRAPTAAN